MKKDFKNVIITFGLIAIALMSGSFLYRKKVQIEYVLATKQEQLQNLIDEQQAVLDSLNQQLGTSSVALEQNNVIVPQAPLQPQAPITTKSGVKPKQPAILPVTTKPVAVQATSKPVVAASPVVKAPIQAPTPPKAPVVVKPTRKSRAS